MEKACCAVLAWTDPAAWSPVRHHGLGDRLGRAEQLVAVAEAEVRVEEVHLAPGQLVGQVGVLNRALEQWSAPGS